MGALLKYLLAKRQLHRCKERSNREGQSGQHTRVAGAAASAGLPMNCRCQANLLMTTHTSRWRTWQSMHAKQKAKAAELRATY